MIGIREGDFEKEVLECDVPVFTCFTTRWCRSCYPACLLGNELAKKYEEKVKFVRVDIEKSPGVAARYHVVFVPTVLLFLNSQPVGKLLGFQYLKPMQSLLNSVTGENEPTEMAQANESDGYPANWRQQ